MKKCKKCKRLKDLSDFYKHKTNKDNLQKLCIDCQKKDRKEKYKRNKINEIKGIKKENKVLKNIKINETETYDYILKIIDKYDLKNKSRKNKYVYRRGAFYRYLRIMSNGELTLEFLGKLIGTDHSNVINSIKTVNSLIESNNQLYYFSVYELEMDLRNCPPIKVKKEFPKIKNISKNNPVLTLINMVFETEGNQHLKAYINENINPNKL